MSEAPLIKTFDQVLGEPTARMVHHLVANFPGWKWGHKSHHDSPSSFWWKRLSSDSDPLLASLVAKATGMAAEHIGAPVELLRMNGNGITAGLISDLHRDDANEGRYTLIYYPHSMRDIEGGDTVFYEDDGRVRFVKKPVADSAVLFDSRILHVGRPPTDVYRDLRVTIALKLKAGVAARGSEQTVNTAA